MKNKKTIKTLVSQNLEFLELELSNEELLSVVGGKTEDSNTLVGATGPAGVAVDVKEPPQGELILINPVNNQPGLIVRPGG